MDSNSVQQALISLEDRFRELRDLGQNKLQAQETTIGELRNQLSQAIAAEMAASQKIIAAEMAASQKIDELSSKLEHKSKEVDILRVRCEISAQRARHAEALKQQLETARATIQEKIQEEEHMLEIISDLNARNRELRSEARSLAQSAQQSHAHLTKSFALLNKYSQINSRLTKA